MKSDLHNVIKNRKALYVSYNIKQVEAGMRKDKSNMENGHKVQEAEVRLFPKYIKNTVKTDQSESERWQNHVLKAEI